MAKIENNIRVVPWKNKGGTKSVRYRVRINRKSLSVDEYFTDLEAANEFVRRTKSEQGRAGVAAEQQKKSELETALQEYAKEPSISWWLDQWADIHYPMTKDPDAWAEIPEADQHRISVARSRIEVAKNVQIVIPEPEMRDAPSIFQGLIKKKFSESKKFGLFKPSEITTKIAVDYVRERKKTVKAATAKRDVSTLRSFFNTLEDIDPQLAKKITQNPFDSAGIRKELKDCDTRRSVRLPVVQTLAVDNGCCHQQRRTAPTHGCG